MSDERKTIEVENLVLDVLATLPQPFGEDITLEVCLAIESNPEWMRRYCELGDELSPWVVNNWIGQYTKIHTGLRSIKQVDAPPEKIIKSYTKLAP